MKSLKTLHKDLEQAQKVDEHGTWAISYGDMVTLLLTFFILFFSISGPEKKQRHYRAVINELVHRFTDTPVTYGGALAKNQPQTAGAPRNSLPQLPQLPDAKMLRQGETIYIEFPGISFYSLGKTDVSVAGIRQLEQFAEQYLPLAGQFHVGIRAFTDSLKVRADRHRFQDNLELSALRSISAMRVLQKAGIPLSRMRIAGQGEAKPIMDRERKLASLEKSKGDPLSRKIVLIIEPDPGDET